MNVKKSTAIASAMTGLLALGAQFIAAPAMAADEKEKCYGVVKASKNDCATKSSSCAGTAKEDAQGDAQRAVREAGRRFAATQVRDIGQGMANGSPLHLL